MFKEALMQNWVELSLLTLLILVCTAACANWQYTNTVSLKEIKNPT